MGLGGGLGELVTPGGSSYTMNRRPFLPFGGAGEVCGMEEQPRRDEDPLRTSVLVLNRTYRPIRIVNARRAFIFLAKESAEAVAQVDARWQNYAFASWIHYSREQIREGLDGHDYVHTPTTTIIVPRVIRLMACDRIPKRTVRFSRRSVMARDEFKCQYCGKKLPASALSVDHVLPRSRGGKTDWLNVVAACGPCNTRKGGACRARRTWPSCAPPSSPRATPSSGTRSPA